MLRPSKESTGFVAYFARAYPWRTVLTVVLLILAGLAEGVGIAALLPALNRATGEAGGGDPITRFLLEVGIDPTLGALLTAIVVAMALKGGFRWLAMRQVGYTLAQVGRDLRRGLIQSLMAARWSCFTSQPTGYFPNAVSTESYRAAMAYGMACNAFADAIQVLVYASLILAISWQVALLALLVGAVVAWPLGRFIDMSRQAGGDQTAVMRSLVARLTDALQGIKSIKAMGREGSFLPMLEEEVEELNRAERRQVLARESLRALQEPMVVLVLAIGLFVALRWGRIPAASLLVMAFLFHRLTGRVHKIQQGYQGMVAGESAFWSLHRITRLAEAEREAGFGDHPPPPLRKELRLSGVSFSYGTHRVLRDVSLTVPAGSFAALVGPSGAGKTTVVDLIVGLHRPDAGEVFVDGVPLGELDLGQWRRMIGYVPQETLLFHDTVYRNVTLGNERLAPPDVERALRQADAWSFVEAMPQGMDTVVGERGSKLSGGQRQRVAIARALVGRPRLLVLDEATTALDPKTETAICATLARLRGEVTILAISHQSAMKGVADAVYEIEGGSIRALERGKPARLRAPYV
ncbi:MAG: ABC transporter ATP-binding protein [Gemmatimonadota bacterium]